MLFKGVSNLELWQSICSLEWNYLCNFGRGYNEEEFCENIFEFGPVVQEKMSFKRFLI